MYYREEIINGILCCKHTSDGEWIPLSQEQLTKKIAKLKTEIERLTHKLEIESRKLHEPI